MGLPSGNLANRLADAVPVVTAEQRVAAEAVVRRLCPDDAHEMLLTLGLVTE